MVGTVGATVVVGSLTAGAASVALAWYLLRHRGRAGANWFIATLVAQAVWAVAYGVGLLVSDPLWRGYAEAVAWVGMVWVGPLFLGFALRYTGRQSRVVTRAFRALLALPAVTTVVALTHPWHGLLWTEFRSARLFELSTVLYTIQPLGYLAAGIGTLAVGVAVLLLVETVLSYGPLYRREALAVALSTVPPAVPLLVWLLGVGPWPALNLAPLFLLPHVALDAYAFVGTHMFETSPTTQRAARRSALTDLGDPMLTVDTSERVVNLNDRAMDLFDVDDRTALPIPLATLLGTPLEQLRSDGDIEVDGPDGGTFAVSHTGLTDSRGAAVGCMLVLYDVTEERRREQHLSVLNRVLRHNLRNEMTVVEGYARMFAEDADPARREQAETMVASSRRLLSISEKVQAFDRVQGRPLQHGDVDVETLLDRVRADLPSQFADATIDTHIGPAVATVPTDEERLRLILTNLVENALVHADTDDGEVTVRLSMPGTGERIRVEVCDGNEQIPEFELAPLGEATESSLQHGSGVGLWIVTWCVDALGGDIRFEYDDGNRVVVDLPATGDGHPSTDAD